MAGGGDWLNASPLLSGLFGSLQQAATNHLSTADLWAQLRLDTGSWQAQMAGTGEELSDQELIANGAKILSQQGVGIQQVNTYRALANQWRTAKDNLLAMDPADQIRGQAIFVPPWAQTTSSAVPSRYRVRVQWEVEPTVGDAFTTWGAYEVSSPLTSLNDLLDQAGQLVGKKPTSNVPLGAIVKGASDYELEQI